MISVCSAVYRAHPAPNVASLAERLDAACGEEDSQLCVALNGIDAATAGVPPTARVKPASVNRGVGPGWNMAASIADGEILVFANDDCEPGPGSLEALARSLHEDATAGVVGPLGSTWDRTAWRHQEFVHPRPGEVRECDVVSGFCFAVRRDTFDAVGGFDEAYAPASWEEVDFNLAVKSEGLRTLAVGADVRHEWGVSAKAPPWRTIRHNGRRELLWSIHRRNRRRFLSKWGGR